MATNFTLVTVQRFSRAIKLTEPVVNPEVGDEVEVENSGDADLLGSKVQSSQHKSEADVGDEDEGGLAGAEDSAGGLEVAELVHADADPLVLRRVVHVDVLRRA